MATPDNTPESQLSYTRTSKVIPPSRKKTAASSLEPKIEFPVEDQSWIALQERAIELAGKPIEDLSYRELQELRLDLSDTEPVTLKEYLRGRLVESSNTFDAIASCRTWTEQLCGQTLEDLIDFKTVYALPLSRWTGCRIATNWTELRRICLNYWTGFLEQK